MKKMDCARASLKKQKVSQSKSPGYGQPLKHLSRSQRGFTLIEVIIASTLGIFLLAGLTQILSNTASNKSLNNGLSAIQESGRYALKMISEAVRYRGFQGCILPISIDPRAFDSVDWTNVSQTQSVADAYSLPNFAASSLRGYEVNDSGTWSPSPASQGYSPDIAALQSGDGGFKPISGSDVISVQYASPRSIPLTTPMATLSDSLVIDNNSLNLQRDSVVFVGDCTLGDVFQISADIPDVAPFIVQHSSTSNSSNLLRKTYGTDAEIREFHVETYFVAETGRVDKVGNPVPALFRRNILGESVELIEGIERLEIRYGELLSTGSVRYRTASEMTADAWAKVATVELGLLARTTHPILSHDDDAVFTLPGELVTPGERSGYTPGRYLRKAFTTLIDVRNRV